MQRNRAAVVAATAVAAMALAACGAPVGEPLVPAPPAPAPADVVPGAATPMALSGVGAADSGPAFRAPSDLPEYTASARPAPAAAGGAASASARPAPKPRAAAPAPAKQAPAGRMLTVYLTGYSFQDNTPPSSARVCCAVLHSVAGGTGTFEDPITVAVPGSGSSMDWKAGTRFYVPRLSRYLVVEDSGAGATPGGVDTHLDVWVGGEGGTKSAVDAAMARITGNTQAELSPPPGRKVIRGPIFSG